MSNHSTKLEIQYLPLHVLRPDPRNPRKHSKRHVQQLAKSIKAFGFNVPVLIDSENQLVAGHGRIEAAKMIGLAEVPTLNVGHLSQHQRQAFMIADNRMTDLSSWDDALLGQILLDLSEAEIDFEIDAIGFSVAEIDLKLVGPEAPDDGDVPQLADGPVISAAGDLWRLGNHLVLCGSAQLEANFNILMGAEKADVVISDPPFNVPIEGNVSGLGKVKHANFVEGVGEMSEQQFIEWLQRTFEFAARFSRAGSLHYWAMDWRHICELTIAARAVYTMQVNLCVWAKTNAGMGSLYRSQHELFAVFRNGKASHRNNVQLGRFGRSRTNLWTYPGASGFSKTDEGKLLALHPTVKPVDLLADAILDSTKRGDLVLDPFLGSGSTLIAAEKIGRHCRGFEIDPVYVDTIIRRWQRWTGERAVRVADGALFDDLVAAAM